MLNQFKVRLTSSTRQKVEHRLRERFRYPEFTISETNQCLACLSRRVWGN